MASNYNRTAWFYDRLSRIVFGNSIINSQIFLIKHIPAKSSLLIIGGGTGWILEKIAEIHSDLSIIYVEVAPNMMALSKLRNYGNNKIDFVTDSIEHVSLPHAADVVLTPFFFSNFSKPEAGALFSHINLQLKPGGLWLNADFQMGGSWWHTAMLQLMYTFFRLFKAVETTRLSDYKNLFKQYGYKQCYQKTFYNNFIISCTQKKQQIN